MNEMLPPRVPNDEPTPTPSPAPTPGEPTVYDPIEEKPGPIKRPR